MYIKINGTELFYERTGCGKPIILLHGNGEDHTIFGGLIKQLSSDYTVYAVDSRGHGKSSKVNHYDYKVMMADIAQLIGQLKIEKPVVYGFSDGGIIGLLLAIEYPQMLSKLMISGVNLNPGGLKPFEHFLMRAVYFFTRNPKYRLMLTQPDITEADLKRVAVPTVVLAGSKDLIKENHTIMIADGISSSRLMIQEGEDHASYVLDNNKLYDIIQPFLGEEGNL